MAKKQFGVRLRPDQESKIEEMMKSDPELDRSKIIRKAIDEFISRIRETPPVYGKKRSSG